MGIFSSLFKSKNRNSQETRNLTKSTDEVIRQAQEAARMVNEDETVKAVRKMIANGEIKRPEPYHTKVVGVTFGKRQEYLEECWEGQDLIIRNKPSEKYPHAMAVYAIDFGEKKRMIGYIGDELAINLYNNAEDSGNWDTDSDDMVPQYTGRIVELTGGTVDRPTVGCNIEIDK